MSDTLSGALYTLSVLTFTKIPRGSKFILVIQRIQLTTTHLNTGR